MNLFTKKLTQQLIHQQQQEQEQEQEQEPPKSDEEIRQDVKDMFLWQVLEELDGFDGILLPRDMYDYIRLRDGECPYTLQEVRDWLLENEDE